MNKNLILELPHHRVYYIKTDVINYYITVPKNISTTNICLEIKNKMGNYDIELNDEIWVMENIKNTYSYIDNYNITLVIPVLKEKHIGVLEKIDSTKYNEIDTILGHVINSSYQVLKQENISVNNQVVFVNNDKYKTFILWFVTKYKDRIVCKNLLELIQLYNANATIYKKLETPVMNFVVGSYTSEVDAPKIVEPEEVEPINQRQLQTSYGFASYWILVIVTIVVAGIVAIVAFTMK